MEGRMPRIRTVSAILAIACAAPASAISAGPAAECLAAPNAQSPQGQHWYYRLDRATHRKCWYLGAQHARGAERAPHRRSAARGDRTAAGSDEDVPARDATTVQMPTTPAQSGIVAAPPDAGFAARGITEPPRAQSAKADVAPDPPAPA